MEIVRGMVVKAAAGKEKNGFFVVTSFDGEYAQICDGKRRPLERPKRKKAKHLCLTKKVLCERSMVTNREIRKALNAQ